MRCELFVRISRFATVLSALWRRCQVELHGCYSVERLLILNAYASTVTSARVLYLFLATIVPCLVVIMVLESFPLAPIEDGLAQSRNFWCRTAIGTFVLTYSMVLQYRHNVRGLALSESQTAIISAMATVLTMPILYAMTSAIGYPMPFFVALSMLPWTPLVVCISAFILRNQLKCDPRIRTAIRQYTMIFNAQSLLIVVYPAYSYLFNTHPSAQTGLALLLPVMKLVLRNWFGYASRHLEDTKPELVVFNVEIFSALYVSSCMQTASSISTTVVIMAVDFVQAWLSIKDLYDVLDDPQLRAALGGERGTTHQLIPLTMHILRCNQAIRDHASIRLRSDSILTTTPQPAAKNSIVPAPAPAATAPAVVALQRLVRLPSPPSTTQRATPVRMFSTAHSLGALRATDNSKEQHDAIVALAAQLGDTEQLLVVQKTLRILHISEFIALIEYAEVFVPIVYSLFCMIAFWFPNGQYYSTFHGLDTWTFLVSLGNVLLYGALELVSFIVLDRVLRRKFQISAFRQAAFVLEKQWAMVQSKLMLWMLVVLQFQLQHYGADFSFQFQWLHPPKPA